ncbi:AAA family ATPase [Methylobacterium hispanicum]|uniref:AAA family ATPase n=1 Tax=Methylobacterium hispanicum TaxID=270350 RepID=UPI002F326651
MSAPVRLEVQVASVVWAGEATTVFSGTLRDGSAVRVVGRGEGFAPANGEVYEVDGLWRNSERYGRQFHGREGAFVRKLPRGKLVGLWLQGIPGVGPERAKRIVRAFGGRLHEVFDGRQPLETLAEAIDPDRPALAGRIAAVIADRWQEVEGEYATLRWLEDHGVEDAVLARRLAGLLGPEAVPLLERNPYVLAAVLPWHRLDPLARQVLGTQRGAANVTTCRERLVGAIDVAMQDAVRGGDTAIRKDALGGLVAKRLGVEGSPDLDERIVRVGLANKALVDGGDRWRAPGCAVMEEGLRGRFAAMVLGERCGIRLPGEADLRRILAIIELRGRPLHPEQREAVLRSVRRGLGCLTGGAGTGKTTTCRAVVDLWESLGGHIQMAALSGKAALRLSEGTGRTGTGARPAHTIHRLLLGLRKRADGQTHWGSAQPGGERHDADRELPELTARTLLVIDEASMVDLGQMHQLVEAMPTGCRMLLVGDPFQLAPVGFGLVFHRLAAQEALTSHLETVHRQEDATGIPQVSRQIRARGVPDLPPYEPGRRGVSFLQADAGTISDEVRNVVRDLVEAGADARDMMVVSAVNRRAASPDGTVQDMNRRLHEDHVSSLALTDVGRERAVLRGYFGNEFCAGDPVTFLRNDYGRGLRNGSLGRVVSVDVDGGVVTCEFEGEAHAFGDRDLIDVSLAYAVSCHRAQGSQARAVVVSLLDAPNVEPTWVYTALTRAEESVVLVGSAEDLTKALSRLPAHELRLTGCAFDLSATAIG